MESQRSLKLLTEIMSRGLWSKFLGGLPKMVVKNPTNKLVTRAGSPAKEKKKKRSSSNDSDDVSESRFWSPSSRKYSEDDFPSIKTSFVVI